MTIALLAHARLFLSVSLLTACTTTTNGLGVNEDADRNAGGSPNQEGDLPVDGSGSTNSGSGGSNGVSCGDGKVNQASEECDDAGESGTCTKDCKLSSCGDGIVNTTASEVCDSGNDNGGFDQCDQSCLFVCEGACPVRVDLAEGDDANDGSAWNSAFRTIQAAVDHQEMAAGGGVWVSVGQSGPLTMKPGVHIYGGFNGSERALNERDQKERTILDGASSDRPLVRAARNAELNGFRLQNGEAGWVGAFPEADGGALVAKSISGLQLKNCDFVDNLAWSKGGAIFLSGGSAVIENCHFEGNAALQGGAIHFENGATVSLSNNRFEGNFLMSSDSREVVGGGALFLATSTVDVSGGSFIGNSANDPNASGPSSTPGADVYIEAGVAPKFSDVSFHAGLLSLGGNGHYINGASPSYSNCSFTGYTGHNASVLFETAGSSSNITNCSFAQNTITLYTAQSASKISNSVLYQPSKTDPAAISGSPTELSNCSEFSSGGLGEEPDVLQLPLADADEDGAPELFLNQSDLNPCFAGGNDGAANAAGINWTQMTTAASGCTDISPVDLGRHYSTVNSAPSCL